MRRKKMSGVGRGLYLELLENRTLLSSGIGVFVPTTGSWSLRSTASAGTANVGTFQFGAYIPVVGDWNGDGADDIGTFNPATAAWQLRYGTSAGTPNAGVFVFGKAGTLPVVGDWNGDGRDDIGVYDPKTATWSLRYGASAGTANAGTFKFGAKNALPVAGDWNGDKKDGIGTYTVGNSSWTLRQTPNAGSANAGQFAFGPKNTLPVVGDWNGDGKDGIGTVDPKTAFWRLRQTATQGSANAGSFFFGPQYAVPVTGVFKAPAPAPTDTVLSSITLKPLDLNLLGLELQTSPITITISAKSGDGKLLGNLLKSGSNFISTTQANQALNNVLSKTVDLANSGSLGVFGLSSGAFDTAPVSNEQILELFVAPSHLETLGGVIDISPVRFSISAHAGDGLVLGNAMAALSNLFNPPLPSQVDIDAINQQLSNVLGQVNSQFGSIPAADVPTTQPNDGDALTFSIPKIDMHLLGLELETDAVTVDALAQAAPGALLGNVWTADLNTRTTTPDKLAQMTNTADAVLARVFGVLNASTLTLSPAAISALTPAMQALANPTLIAPAGASTQIMDLVLSATGATPPATVNLLGLGVAGNNVNGHLAAQTGDGQILGNLLYNAANLANPGASPSLIALMQALASNSTASVGPVSGALSGAPATAKQLFTVTLPPLDLNLLGMEVQTDAITVKLTAESADGNLLGNMLRGYTSLLNLGGVSGAVNNVLSTAASLANSASLTLSPGTVGSGAFDSAQPSTTTLLDVTVAPIHVNLTGMLVDTSPIHLTIIAHAGDGLVLGNVLTSVAHVFDPPLPNSVDPAMINAQLQNLLAELNAQVPGVAPAPLPSPGSDPANVLAVTVPGLNLDLLGLGLKTDPIVVTAAARTGTGDFLGNVCTALLNGMSATPSALAGVSTNVNALLAKIMGVFNTSSLTLSAGAIAALPVAYQTLANPTLINKTPGATASILDVGITSASGTNPPTSAGLLGLAGTSSGIHVVMTARTGDGQVLGNMLYNVANLLNSGSSNFVYLLGLLG
jgi:hypothetical protein